MFRISGLGLRVLVELLIEETLPSTLPADAARGSGGVN